MRSSIIVVVSLAPRKSGEARTRRRNSTFVETPAMRTASRAVSSRAIALARFGPKAMTYAIIGS